MKWLDNINASMHMNLRKLWEIGEDKELVVLHSMGSQRVRQDLDIEKQLQEVSLKHCLQQPGH